MSRAGALISQLPPPVLSSSIFCVGLHQANLCHKLSVSYEHDARMVLQLFNWLLSATGTHFFESLNNARIQGDESAALLCSSKRSATSRLPFSDLHPHRPWREKCAIVHEYRVNRGPLPAQEYDGAAVFSICQPAAQLVFDGH